MSFDTKYRPRIYSDVLGQEDIVEILRRYVASGKGLHQSYLFAGGFGSGKTTLGRIMARALLCPNPTVAGDPCDQCESCRNMLEHGTSMDFYEVDAATNSGKADIQKIVDEIQYDTFAGRRRIYLFDESHQLTGNALDAMLKPMEDMVAGTLTKRLICIFCTTEPEKMRPTIFSRCAPAFVIQPVSPAGIARRLAYVCQQEGISYEQDMLVLMAETVECHIRDALKALEGISMLGPVNRENTTRYLKLDLNSLYLDVLEGLRVDQARSLTTIHQLLAKVSPVTCYERLADICIYAYQAGLQVGTLPTYLDRERLLKLSKQHGPALLQFALRFGSRPGRPTASMLLCDLAALHHDGPDGALSLAPRVESVILPAKEAVASSNAGKPLQTTAPEMDPADFCLLLLRRLQELDGQPSGQARLPHLGSP